MANKKAERRNKEDRSNIIRIEIGEGEIEGIFTEIFEAQEKISRCYERLVNLGVVAICKKADSGN